MTRALRAVGPNETPPKPLTLEEASQRGDTLAELRALRVINAKKMADPNISGRDLAALSRRQMEIAREIDAMVAREQQETASDVDAIEDGAFDASAV